MKILVVGASGTIGRAVAAALESKHEVLRAGSKSGDYQMDLGNKATIEAALDALGRVDAIVCTAGQAKFAPLSDLTDEDFALGLQNKLMGQVNLVRVGLTHVSDGGSITLTSGMLSQTPMPGSASVSLVGAGIEGFARSAALEAPRKIRVNVVSPIWVKETMEAMGMDSATGMSAADTARAYVETVEGDRTGETLDVREFV
jgi:NAD(P)-dependent dehydrogenase (short-subunit alcohol dehydrogenase family)